MKSQLKRALFSLLGKDPEAVVLAAAPLAATMQELTPGRELILIEVIPDESAGSAWLRLRRACRGHRIALAAIPTREKGLLRAALLAFPNKVLAFHDNRDRHHLHWSSPIASLLFLSGVPLDRIFLRPWRKNLSVLPQTWRALDGRPWRPGKPRIAVLSPYCTYPLAHGGAVRLHNLLREASHDFDIALFAFEDGQTQADFDQTLAFCSRLYIAAKPYYREPRWSTLTPPEACEFYTPALHEQLRHELAELGITILQTEYTQMARYGGDILTEHDVTFDLFAQIHANAPSLRTWWDLFRWRRFEQRALGRFPHAVAMSDKDAALLERFHHCCRPPLAHARGSEPNHGSEPNRRSEPSHDGQGVDYEMSEDALCGPNVTVIPNGVDLTRFTPEPEPDSRNLLFIGSFRHFPNVRAYRFFVEQVWPLLASEQPAINATVVAGPDPHLYWPHPSPDPRIALRGFTSDVRPLYVETNLVLIPTVVSAGTNLKALEAMAMQRAIVSTTSGVAGLGIEHGHSVWIADTPREFAAAILRLLDDAGLRATLARNARDIAVAKYGWPALAELQTKLWRSLLVP
ncbi:MAG TPA: glycosyltransferase [Paludibaculum sp.]|jgi:glycosyltransferase involved in cell wall biosynthesis